MRLSFACAARDRSTSGLRWFSPLSGNADTVFVGNSLDVP